MAGHCRCQDAACLSVHKCASVCVRVRVRLGVPLHPRSSVNGIKQIDGGQICSLPSFACLTSISFASALFWAPEHLCVRMEMRATVAFQWPVTP